ncbi:MAG TPA: acyl-CoA thioesterase domain-containing protein [Frankiaceae bacterium]|nr:acyl-CoA thioesterase domain-containing protein [Frankiaceae bacterium]
MASSLAGMLEVFDVRPAGEGRFTGSNDYGERDIVDASQVLAQAIVAATKTVQGKVVRRASGVFCRPVIGKDDIDFGVEVVQNGRNFATAMVTAAQHDRTRAVVTVLLDVPSADVVRHPVQPAASSPDAAIPLTMAMTGREIRLVGLANPNDPDEVGPPRIEAWLRYDQTPSRGDLARALLAHFTGHLSISTTMRPHRGVGTAQAHRTLSTGVIAIDISFHDPVGWDGWILYDHESTSVSAGMSYVRGQIRDASGRLLASFSQDGLIRHFEEASGAQAIDERSRL